MPPIDYTNNQQVEHAVMQHISSALRVWELADVSTDDNIAWRIHNAHKVNIHDRRPPGSVDAVKAALGRLYAAGRIWSRRHIRRNGEHQLWYGLPPTTDEQRLQWAGFDQKLADSRAAYEAAAARAAHYPDPEPEEPAADE